MPTQASIVAQIQQVLQISQPTLDTSIGSPIRLILDAVSEVIAEQTADQYLLNYQYDINSMSGSDLDNFTQLFGIYRYPATRATGFVTFSSTTVSSQDLTFGSGLQIQTSTSPPVLFSTTVPASILANSTPSVTIPVQCVLPGSVGNVAANTITQGVSPTMSISSITNQNATSGGSDVESDDQLRARFKTTVFRGMFGTQSMFEGIALDTSGVTQANVIGSSKTFYDQLQFINGVAQSSVDDLAYLLPQTDYLSNNSGNFYSRNDYTFTQIPLVPPAPTFSTAGSGSWTGSGAYTYCIAFTYAGGATTLGLPGTYTPGSGTRISVYWGTLPYASLLSTISVYRLVSGIWQLVVTLDNTHTAWTDSTGSTTTPWVTPVPGPSGALFVSRLWNISIPDGVYQFQFDYVPTVSRNDPPNNLTNRIDLFVNGQNEVEVIENIPYQAVMAFNNTDLVDLEHGATSMNVLEFQRLDGTNPRVANSFLPLAYAPIVQMGTQFQPISVTDQASTTFTQGIDYWIINESSQFGESNRSRAGLEITPSMVSSIASNIVYVDYLYNSVPAQVASNIDLWRLTTTDVMVHAAQEIYLDMFLAVVLGAGSTTLSSVYPQIQTAIEDYLSSITYDGVIEISAILSAVQQVPGIVAARFLNSADLATPIYGTGPLTAFGQNYFSGATVSGTGSAQTYTIGTNPAITVNPWVIGQYVTITSFSSPTWNISSGKVIATGGSSGSGWSLTVAGTNSSGTISVASEITSNFAIEQMNPITGSIVKQWVTSNGSIARGVNVSLTDAQLPALNNLYLTQMSQSNFGNL